MNKMKISHGWWWWWWWWWWGCGWGFHKCSYGHLISLLAENTTFEVWVRYLEWNFKSYPYTEIYYSNTLKFYDFIGLNVTMALRSSVSPAARSMCSVTPCFWISHGDTLSIHGSCFHGGLIAITPMSTYQIKMSSIQIFLAYWRQRIKSQIWYLPFLCDTSIFLHMDVKRRGHTKTVLIKLS